MGKANYMGERDNMNRDLSVLFIAFYRKSGPIF